MTPHGGSVGRMIADLFAGAGGWSVGLQTLGLHDVGLEWDKPACRTRAAAGHRTICCDVAAYPTEPFVGRVRGLIASPPCQAFSMAGKGHGRKEIDKVHAAVELCRDGWTDAPLAWTWSDARTPLILQPLRWAWALRPVWIALEQVPTALGVWQHMADVLRGWGYGADALVLCSADFGVPQTRDRAYLVAHRDGVRWPEPTHAEKPEPSLFGAARLPWVTMAQALGWGYLECPSNAVRSMGAGQIGPDPLNGGQWSREKLARARTAGAYVERVLRQNNTAHAAVRGVGEPAPTLQFGGCGEAVDWLLNPGQTATQPNRRLDRAADEPAPTVGFGHDAANWQWQRPATTLVSTFGSDVVSPPGYRRAGDGPRQSQPGSIRITQAEAAVLMGFAPDYPWQGTKSQQFSQIGNCVTPPIATALIGALERLQLSEAA